MKKLLLIALLIVGAFAQETEMDATKPTIELLSASLELIEPVNFPLYEFSGRSEGEVTH